MATLLRPPHLVVYLKASRETLRNRISQRGRDYEQEITDDYLSQLNELYDAWARDFRLCPVLTVDTNNLNYVQYEDHLDQILHRVEDRLSGREYLELE
jgi:deoxyadenosine/deoxycytidine kinase